MADVDENGGSVRRGQTFTFSHTAGGLTGVLYVSLISALYGTVPCSEVVISDDNNGSAKAPASGVKPGETLKITYT